MTVLSKSRIVAAACLLAASLAQAGTITVTDNLSYPDMSDSTCTLSQAIAAANVANGVGTDTIGSATTDTGTNKLGNCGGATSGANTIVFDPALAGATLTYTTADFASTPCPCFTSIDPSNYADNFWYGLNALPPIASDIRIDGGAAGITLQITSVANRLRFFYVSGGLSGELPAGSLSLQNMTLSGGIARGGLGGGGGAGMGGAIFNQGTLNLTAVTLTSNSAIGGESIYFNYYSGGGMGDRAATSASGGMGGGYIDPGNPSFLGAHYGGNGGSGGASGWAGGGGGFITGADGADGGTSGSGGGSGGGLGGLGGRAPGVSGARYGDGGDGGYIYNQSVAGVDKGGAFGSGAEDGFNSACGGGGVGGGGGGECNGSSALNVSGSGGFGGGGGGSPFLVYGGSGGFGGGGGFGDAADHGGSGGFGGGDGGVYGGNGAGMGGAIFNHRGSLTLTNVTMAGNTAAGGTPYSGNGINGSGLGAAIFNLNGTVSIAYSTLANNAVSGTNIVHDYIFADGFESGFTTNTHSPGDGTVYSVAYGNKIEDGTASLAALTITDSIISGTVASTGAGNNDVVNNVVAGTHPANTGNVATLTYSGKNIIGASWNVGSGTHATATQVGAPTSSADPNLGALANNGGPTQTLLPQSGSAAIDAIAPVAGQCAVSMDQRGQPRPIGGGCDIGSVEQ